MYGTLIDVQWFQLVSFQADAQQTPAWYREHPSAVYPATSKILLLLLLLVTEQSHWFGRGKLGFISM